MPDNSPLFARLYKISGAKNSASLARWMGLSLTAVRNLERGKSSPDIATLRMLEKKTGENFMRLYSGMPLEGSKGYDSVSEGADYLDRVDADHGEALPGGGEQESEVPLIQLMAALRRIAAHSLWYERSAVTQVILKFDPEILQRWAEIRDEEIAQLRRILFTDDAERQGRG